MLFNQSKIFIYFIFIKQGFQGCQSSGILKNNDAEVSKSKSNYTKHIDKFGQILKLSTITFYSAKFGTKMYQKEQLQKQIKSKERLRQKLYPKE